jgi:hypothetical protein
MRYLTFIEDRKYTTDDGEECSLAEHLADLRKWGGTPDFFDSDDNLQKAKAKTRNENLDLLIVDTQNEHRPVYRHRCEPQADAPSPF